MIHDEAQKGLFARGRGGAGGDAKHNVTVRVSHGEHIGAYAFASPALHSMSLSLSLSLSLFLELTRSLFTARAEEGKGEAYSVDVSPSDTVRALKDRIAGVISSAEVDPEALALSFGPSERVIGKRFRGDPLVDEDSTLVGQYSFLQWLEQFPHWCLTVSMAKDTPPPPGVAIKKAAASAEGEDPDLAVQQAYASGELLRPEELPAPWGDKGTDVYKRDAMIRSVGDNPAPPGYGASVPSSNAVKAAGAGWEPCDVEHVPNVLDLEE